MLAKHSYAAFFFLLFPAFPLASLSAKLAQTLSCCSVGQDATASLKTTHYG